MALKQPAVLLLFVVIACLCSCTSSTKRKELQRGIYYWKTNLRLGEYERQLLDTLKVERLYTRFFDVDISADGKRARPNAIINFGQTLPHQEIVPVVFITPRAMEVMPRGELSFYAKEISQLLAQLCASRDLEPEEIQIDFDWTASNKAKYFELLQLLRAQAFFAHKRLSVTIRLHQVKYMLQAGIPPADKGLLMVYNMEPLTDFKVENSIIRKETVAKYLQNIEAYPLQLDIALPIFSWTLLFEGEKLKGIMRNLQPSSLKDTALFSPIGNNRFQVRKDSIWNGYRLSTRSVLRHEESDIQVLNAVVKFLSPKIKTDSLTLILYHCDSVNFSKYHIHELEKIYTDFR